MSAKRPDRDTLERANPDWSTVDDITNHLAEINICLEQAVEAVECEAVGGPDTYPRLQFIHTALRQIHRDVQLVGKRLEQVVDHRVGEPSLEVNWVGTMGKYGFPEVE